MFPEGRVGGEGGNLDQRNVKHGVLVSGYSALWQAIARFWLFGFRRMDCKRFVMEGLVGTSGMTYRVVSIDFVEDGGGRKGKLPNIWLLNVSFIRSLVYH